MYNKYLYLFEQYNYIRQTASYSWKFNHKRDWMGNMISPPKAIHLSPRADMLSFLVPRGRHTILQPGVACLGDTLVPAFPIHPYPTYL